MFDNRGESGLPCGVPACRMLTIPSFMMPAFRYRRIRFSRRVSLTFLRHPADQHIVIDLVKEFLSVQVHDPSDGPARCSHARARRRAVRYVPDGIHSCGREKPGSNKGLRTCKMAWVMNRSRTVGIPSIRVPPPGLGHRTSRTGEGM